MIVRKFLNTIAFLSITSAMCLVILMGYWLLHDYKLIQFKDNVFPVVNKEVERGSLVFYKVNACKYTDEMPSVKRFFVDGLIYETSESVGTAEGGCRVTTIGIYVPKALPVGKYHFKVISTYHPNPIRTIQYVNSSETFEVK